MNHKAPLTNVFAAILFFYLFQYSPQLTQCAFGGSAALCISSTGLCVCTCMVLMWFSNAFEMSSTLFWNDDAKVFATCLWKPKHIFTVWTI